MVQYGLRLLELLVVKNKLKTYAELNDELSEALAWFDGEDLDLDMATKKYQQALELLKQLEAYLKTAENKIKKIDPGF